MTALPLRRDDRAVPPLVAAPEAEAHRSDHPLATSRPVRVTLLIVACTLMGLTDLLCTLAYVGGAGMVEKNPLARLVIIHGGAEWLVAFKLLTMLVTGVCIYFARRHVVGERCAWLCALLLTALTAHWVRVNEQMIDYGDEITLIASTYETMRIPQWVRFED